MTRGRRNALDELGTEIIVRGLNTARTVFITGPVAIIALILGGYIIGQHWKLIVGLLGSLVVLVVLGHLASNWLLRRARAKEKALYPPLEELAKRAPRATVDTRIPTTQPVRVKTAEAPTVPSPRISPEEDRHRQFMGPFRHVPDAAWRPTAGRELAAYTDAWLLHAGLFNGKTIRKALAVTVAGQRALTYHITQGNFSINNGEVSLTAKGTAHFLARRKFGSKLWVSIVDSNAWVTFFRTGGGSKAEFATIKGGVAD